MRFSVFTHVIHLRLGKSIFAYSPYVREMKLWFSQAEEVEIIAPIKSGNRDSISIPYQNENLNFTPIPSFHLLSLKDSLRSLFKIPVIIYKVCKGMYRSDHIHLRCPGNIGLLASICQIFFPHKLKTTKYAGNWDPSAKQPWSYKFQRWLLSNTFLTRNMKVLVYGDWPGQTKNVVPFFTASFSEKDREIINKNISAPYKFLFVGNLVPGKQPEVAIQIVEELQKRNIPAELHIYGDGELMESIKNNPKNIPYIQLHGNQPLEVLKQAYIEAHFLILASKSEGWPKAVAEAMFFGCIPIATPVSCVPWMLGGGSRGILMSAGNVWNENLEESGQCTEDSQDVLEKVVGGHPPASGSRAGRSLPEPPKAGVDCKEVVEGTVERIFKLINHPEEMRRMSSQAQEWSQEYTLEKFETEIKKLLSPQPPKGEQISKL